MQEAGSWAEQSAGAEAVAVDSTQRAVQLSILLLAAMSIVGVLGISRMYQAPSSAAGVVVTFVLVATPVATFLAYGLARVGYTLPAAVFSVAIAAVGAVVAALLEPSLVTPASTYLMLAAIVLVGSQIMPFEYAAGLGIVNAIAAAAMPSFMPVAGPMALQLPYVFLFSNAMLLLFAGILRQHDRARVHVAQQKAAAAEVRYDLLRSAADRMRLEHGDQVRRLQEGAKAQQHLLDAASHELRTPITPLLLQVAAFRKRYEDRLDEEQDRGLELLERNLKRLALLVGDLLDIARLENGRLVLRPRVTDLDGLVEQARMTFLPQAMQSDVRIEVDVEPGLRIYADGTRLSQVIYNLVSNAIKFSPAGGTVRIAARHNAGGVEIHIDDQGAGLEAWQRRRLFQPFSQVHDPTTGIKGTGLGLYITRGIVVQHGGQVWVTSEGRGKGTRFGVWFPDRVPDAPEEAVELPAAAKAPSRRVSTTG